MGSISKDLERPSRPKSDMSVLGCSRMLLKSSLERSQDLTGPHGATSTAYQGDGYRSPGIIDMISYEIQHEPNIDLVLSSLMAFDMALQIAIDCTMHGETIFYAHLNRGEEAGGSEELR